MRTHRHFVLWSAGDGDLSAFLQRLTGSLWPVDFRKGNAEAAIGASVWCPVLLPT
jgi:hypothetical protein